MLVSPFSGSSTAMLVCHLNKGIDWLIDWLIDCVSVFISPANYKTIFFKMKKIIINKLDSHTKTLDSHTKMLQTL